MNLFFKPKDYKIEIDLPASKSIHNRVMILNALYDLNLKITNPSNSSDSVLLQKLLKSKSDVLDCENAGTVFRFLTAYFSVKNEAVTLTGSQRMQNRPIAELVNSLKELGTEIDYLDKIGFPPIKIIGGLTKDGSVNINGGVSSQFISALTMIGPILDNGLEILTEGHISSKPYIEMTVKLMQNLGFDVQFIDNKIITKPWNRTAQLKSIEIEPDWSAVAFWFQIASLNPKLKTLFKRLKTQSVQGDLVLYQWAEKLGLRFTETKGGLLLKKTTESIKDITHWDFTNYPDLAPSIIILLSVAKKIAVFTGLESLKIKESDRTLALQTELKKCGVDLIENNSEWILDASKFELQENTLFENYDDHRIAMALAILAFIKPIQMENLEAVNKSYPDFWEHLRTLKS
jgi:3-phosphoshikimate 1-carboxyvinyltransferase